MGTFENRTSEREQLQFHLLFGIKTAIPCLLFGSNQHNQETNSTKISMGENMETTTSTVRIGGCEGPEAMYVKLISADDHEFFIKRETALASGTIKAMLSGPGQYRENEANEIRFKEIPSHVLSKICTYFMYRVKYADSAQEVPEFPIAADIALELLMAANFLDC